MRLHTIALPTFVVGVVLLAATAPAAAQASSCESILGNATKATSATTGPGGQLAAAIGTRSGDIGSELNDRWFDARLANATSNESRARIIAAETDRIERRLDQFETCWETVQTSPEEGAQSEALTPSQADALQRQALSLHRHINETSFSATTLPPDLRATADIDAGRMKTLERRVVSLRDSISRWRAERGTAR